MSNITLNFLVTIGLRGNQFAALCALGEAVPRSSTARSIADRTDAEWDEIMSKLCAVAFQR